MDRTDITSPVVSILEELHCILHSRLILRRRNFKVFMNFAPLKTKKNYTGMNPVKWHFWGTKRKSPKSDDQMILFKIFGGIDCTVRVLWSFGALIMHLQIVEHYNHFISFYIKFKYYFSVITYWVALKSTKILRPVGVTPKLYLCSR